jgi:ubiquilin
MLNCIIHHRLIESASPLIQDDDQLSVYKIQSSHTIHMVKGAARSTGPSSSTQTSTPQPLPSMQTGQNVHDPLTQLNSHMGYGLMAGLNPFADMGVNPNDPNMVRFVRPAPASRVMTDVKLQSMMNSPEFLRQMSSLMSNPAILEQALALNPQYAAMGPQAREIFQSERFREMMFAFPPTFGSPDVLTCRSGQIRRLYVE